MASEVSGRVGFQNVPITTDVPQELLNLKVSTLFRMNMAVISNKGRKLAG